ncbi:DUF5132 domain-containing protein [Methylocapsa sp. S129]|uniref:DUF5132 domain-containing protein n=1 Tax=Methylocapsa sp. S129 TaxID=1641869 RepID=UPI00131E577C|nr:DUF5132 domain-containing protein [Methylocapsa sp. S129]
MTKTKLNGDIKDEEIDLHDAESAEQAPGAANGNRDAAIATAATVGVVAVGAVIFEAALIPGLVLGVAAVLAPQYLPKIGSALTPLFRSTVRGAYKLGQKSREAFAEAQEHIHDIAAEVNAEDGAKAKASDVKAAAA